MTRRGGAAVGGVPAHLAAHARHGRHLHRHPRPLPRPRDPPRQLQPRLLAHTRTHDGLQPDRPGGQGGVVILLI